VFKLATVLYLITQLLWPFPLFYFLLQNTGTKENTTRTKNEFAFACPWT